MKICLGYGRIFSKFSFIVKPNNLPRMSTFPKAFVRYSDAEDTLKINFSFGTAEFSDRLFTFVRSKEEKLETTLARMQLKILDAMNKKISKKKKRTALNDENTITLPKLSIYLSKGEDSIDGDLKCIDAWTSCTELRINENVYQIIRNPPSVLHLSLPKIIMAGFPVYPKITLEFCSKDQCQFTWYRLLTKSNLINCKNEDIIKIKGESWLPLSNTFFYITNEDDVGCRLKLSCIPKCEDKIGIEEIVVSPDFVQLGPKRCPFEDRHEYTKEITNSGSLRCVSYNILADLYADTDTARNDLFPYCPTEAIMIDYRKQLYLKEIIGYNGDVTCLQEVDRKIFYDDLIPVLSSTGLDGIYSEKGGQVVEGLSCFYRASKFKLIESHAIILSDAIKTEPVLQEIYAKVSENENLKEKLMNRTTALQVVLLESIDVPNKRILIGNTHLYFHPLSDNIRLIQAASFILYLESLLNKYKQENPSYTTNLLLMGDFNSCPENGVYKLMTAGNLNKNSPDWNSNPEEIVAGLALKHSLTLGSACGTPDYTNYTEGFIGCLDYIFYDKSGLKVCDVVPFPKHEQVIENRALPSKLFPSDHIALICTLKWK